MKSLESLNPEIWNSLNKGGFSLQMGARNIFARIAMNQRIEEKANKNTQTPSGTKGYSLKSDAVVCYSITANYRRFYSWMLGEMIKFYNTDNQYKDLRPAYIERDKKNEGTKLAVSRKCLLLLENIPFL